MHEEFLKKFEIPPNTDIFVRKEIFVDNKKRKVVAFGIYGLDAATEQQCEASLKRSNEILEKEKNNFDKNIVLYKWSAGDFYKEDTNDQDWFKI